MRPILAILSLVCYCESFAQELPAKAFQFSEERFFNSKSFFKIGTPLDSKTEQELRKELSQSRGFKMLND